MATGNYRKRLAILCGISDYPRRMGGKLPIISSEIDTIEQVLSNDLHDGYQYQVKSYKDNELELTDVLNILELYKQDSPIDELFFYFSGHGTIYNDEAYFVTFGATETNPGIKLSELASHLNSLHPGIKQIFAIFDFCFSGGILEAINLTGSDRLSVLTATRKNQLAETITQDGKSFAQHFIDGLTNALPDKNGEISFGRLALYVSEQMQDSYVQSPSFFSLGYPINKIQKFFFVPLHQNPFFIEQNQIISRLQTALIKNRNVTLGQVQAINGLGGIGKTQTALEYCYRYKHSYSAILWVNSENQIILNNSYFLLASLLKLVEVDNPKTLKMDQIILLVKNWLVNHQDWLMVWDNLEDSSLLKDYLPPDYNGHILITTRLHDLGSFSSVIELNTMDEGTGSLFLLNKLGLLKQKDTLDLANPDELKLAKHIVQEMGGLPLALDQAAAYILQTNSSLDKYLSLYKDTKYSARLRDKRSNKTDDHASVFMTFSMAFEKINEQNPTAAIVLQTCAFLSPDFIPEEIFTKAGNFLGEQITPLVDDELLWDEVIELLLNFSLIKRDSTNNALSIHRLVQAVIKDIMDNDMGRSKTSHALATDQK